MPSPAAVTEHYPPCPRTSWMETQLHLIHFWFSSFSFLSLCSAPLLSFSVCRVSMSPTPLLCHQLALLVSKSWSHCACVALFMFSITHMLSMLSTIIKLILDMHIYIVFFYQPLTSPWQSFVDALASQPYFSQNGSSLMFWCALVPKPKSKSTPRCPFINILCQLNEWYSVAGRDET